MTKNKKENWEKEFNKLFVIKTYPFLGGQRDYLKNKDGNVSTPNDEMETIENIKLFIKKLKVGANKKEK